MPDRTHPRPFPVTLAALLAAACVLAAPSARAQQAQPTLKRVEQGREDAGPLARSIRVAPTDLRLPIGFDQVYRLENTARNSQGDLYARRSGGITAVFPRSQYSVSASGSLLAEIPPGTTFYIGGLPESLTRPEKARVRQLPETYIDRSARPARADVAAPVTSARQSDATARSAAPRGTPPAPASDSPSQRSQRPIVTPGAVEIPGAAAPRRTAPDRPSVFSDESYRSKRVESLLNRAAQAISQPAAGAATAPAADAAKEKPRR
ncbi:MAG: hypothetical protein GIKADHBN_02085 [Phycisphaerales bacterium]|nr:hypothetical protein [Phycisphaerales bacterium]